ncbi:MAG: GNAT family N-acetyltransferase [Acidobacteria bacterium]|nr:GNAT family N-acetyltransferase [Acidobacteriota bacterium]
MSIESWNERLPPLVRVRHADEADSGLLYELFKSVRGKELEVAGLPASSLEHLLRIQHDAQRRSYQMAFPDLEVRIVEIGGKSCGQIALSTTDDAVHLVDVSIAPAERGRGVGNCLVRLVCEDAAARDLPVKLHVAAGNPARRLYERIGFRLTKEDAIYDSMEWRAEPRPRPPAQ